MSAGNFKYKYTAVTSRDIRFNPSRDEDWFFWAPPKPIEKRDDSGIPEWLLRDNASYFRELHRTVDDVSAPMGVRVSR